mmetsp:Transcript_11547/g.25267  ORF Transcript_11547/g.25267 Transcript_11547/m.25267 type:complete len:147 (-) Transcript_11547:158-598(-)|eukprot:CAMPEP_0113297664 /NCGR_PEP_ID=MMETSP0010_2-20120614/434_1 /TAXON_ID=216773 ORGANISM="Corethron hystrix, Strain 308" /NCGR_SAMPLE_ID=MMETSP0010_2 /ASSEMBLY_ACC=CAM_ASM_000155 /LENGTH=146 /DNA_ID=CAMNT_0000150595 /DNA_START=208 /DNA_END=648 /DNA_ORIENTATION=- /assembly_acc=CAM_ASM_000155
MKSITTLAMLFPLANAFAPIPSFSVSSRMSTDLYASIEFVKGLSEKVIPDVSLTRARDGSSGTATFKFDNPNVFDASTASEGEITGMYLVDEEGQMSTSDVNAKFLNGKPTSITSMLVLKSPEEWDRFMRFMERYGEENGLGFSKS